MSERINDGGPAFPCETYNGQPLPGGSGMTLRDWFAGQALAGLLADPRQRGPGVFAVSAQDAYAFADAMLEARK